MSDAGPLQGITVVDLTRILAGPFSTMILGDLGARVIKIERPGGGDDTRRFGPPFARDEDGKDTSEAAYYLAANRGKESLTLDISKPEGRKIVRALVARSDLLLENFKVGALRKYGLAYDDLKGENPGLIYCSITGFGQTGPYRDRAGYDGMIQAMGGLMSVTGYGDAGAGGGPLRVGVPISDLLAGMYAVIGVLAALAHRQRTGEGQYIDIALMDATVATLANQAMNYLATGVSPARIGNTHPNIVPYQAFTTADGYIVVAVGNDGQFVRFCEVIEMPGLARDARFATNIERVRNRAALIPVLEEVMRGRGAGEWYATLDAAGIPCGPINDLEQVFADPQVRARDMKLDLAHPLCGTVPQVGSPLKLSATPVACDRAPPLLGQNTDEILRGLDLSEAEIGRLRNDGVV